jgi:hypothetical protein
MGETTENDRERRFETMSSIIPNTTPWTMLVEVLAYVDSDYDTCVTQYPLTGWRIDAEGAHPVVCGDLDNTGDVLMHGDLFACCVHALMDGCTGVCREVGGGDECSVDDLIRVARKRLEYAQADHAAMRRAAA